MEQQRNAAMIELKKFRLFRKSQIQKIANQQSFKGKKKQNNKQALNIPTIKYQ